jgi:hypothetical protein
MKLKSYLTICLPVRYRYNAFYIFYANYLSFDCVFSFILAPFRPTRAGYPFGMRIRSETLSV